ncbi:hypothetical protein H0H81_004148 [Sphagnurus paluster]|uniref:DNA replication regulator Sld3 C-terminal domain-containing protein n=1 Tax=Sphagnurus paluster TaxID=117069 RepID=A0A9P7K475_9AGAR|nr:hypothetical protein H0H81_004148 [Sphagnurus paluster]
MPLHLLVPSLLRVSPTPTPTEPHPLHAHLKPLLQTARAASRKYTVELPQILVHGGGAGEIEEAVMWFALSCERADGGTGGEAEEEERWAGMAGPWEDPVWRAAWLERMERREFKIQILLYFLKLSLPGPAPAPPPSSPKKRKRGQPKEEVVPAELPADECLEIFMDKMSMWQLMAGLENAASPVDTLATEKTRDWMQVFFEEVVKPQFEKQLPEMCALMRSKLFPSSPSPSSRDTSPSTSRATSPDIPKQKQKRDSSSTTSTSKTSQSQSQTRARTLTRNRSRSLSVSLAQERLHRERERSSTSTGAGTSKKRMLNREVSMSRAFKPKPRATAHAEESQSQAAQKALRDAQKEQEKREARERRERGVLLVEATPTKPKPGLARSQSQSQSQSQLGVSVQRLARTQSSLFQPSSSTSLLLRGEPVDSGEEDAEGEEEEEWYLPGTSSPGVLILSPGLGRRVGDAQILVDGTPTKKKARLR